MDVIGWITAMYVVAWVAVYGDDIKKDLTPKDKPAQVQEVKDGNTRK
jgi:hypothetical protein